VISVALTGAGVLSRTFFAWRYDRRDRERLRTQLERERLELEQVKREVERLSEREERHKD